MYIEFHNNGAFQALRNAVGEGVGCQISHKKRYEGVMFNVISITRVWVGVKYPGNCLSNT